MMSKVISKDDGLSMLTKSSDCFICRGCCRFYKEDKRYAPFFAGSEKKIVDDVLGKNDKFIFRKDKDVYQCKLVKTKAKYDDDKYYSCIFLDEKTHYCGIYAQRPFDCRFWPYILIRDKSGKIEIRGFHKIHCKSLRETHDSVLKAHAKGILKYIHTPAILKLLKENPGLVLDHDADEEYYEMTSHVGYVNGI